MAKKSGTAVFNGTITPELRAFIRQRRQSLGITLQQLSRVLHVNWSTIRKWEDGITRSCRQQHICRLAHFLSGEYDEILGKMNGTVSIATWERPKGISPMLSCIERIHNMYKICDDYPGAGQRLLNDIHEILQEMVERLLEASTFSSLVTPAVCQEEEE